MVALGKLEARYRGRGAESPLPADRRALAGTGHSLLMTKLGPLDCLGAIEEGRDYEALVPLSVDVEFNDRRLRVLTLETIVALKRNSTELKDRLNLPIFEAALKATRGQ
jgi:hypothetical protein